MEKLTGTIIRAIQDKKGKNIVSLDLSKIDGAICSCFIVCNADSTTQVAAIAAGIGVCGTCENMPIISVCRAFRYSGNKSK